MVEYWNVGSLDVWMFGSFKVLLAFRKEVGRPFARRVVQGKDCGGDFFEGRINPPLPAP